MWTLIMGTSYSSEEEAGEDIRSVSDQMVENVRHKTREEGDGMERPPQAAATSDSTAENHDKNAEAGEKPTLERSEDTEQANESVSSVNSPSKFVEVKDE